MARAARGPLGRGAGRALGWAVAFALATAAPGGATEPEGAVLADAGDLARRSEQAVRAKRSYLEGRMTVSRPGLGRSRVVHFRAWDDRENDRSLVRVLAPARDAGTTFLRLPPNLWRYDARDRRVSRVPRSLLLEPWMEGDFTHDDLLHASDRVEDYEHRLVRIDTDADGREGTRAYVVEYRPREGAPLAWPRIVAWLAAEDAVVLRRDYYDADGVVVRTLRFDDFRSVGGRRVPHRWISLWPGTKPRESKIEIEAFQFDPVFEEDLFTPRSLQGGGASGEG